MSQPDDEQVRRLLADARHTEPIPDDVAARLDAVLADLRTEPPAAPSPRPADLGAARRRRNARSWLIAAAAVVAIGIGVNQVVDLRSPGGSSDSASSATSPQEAQASRSDTDGPGADSGGRRPDGPGYRTQEDSAPRDAPKSAGVALDSDRFAAQVTRIGGDADLSALASGRSTPSDGHQELADGCRADADAGRWGAGRVVAVTYDDAPGVLVFRPTRGQTQVVDLFLCDQHEMERSITLPLD